MYNHMECNSVKVCIKNLIVFLCTGILSLPVFSRNIDKRVYHTKYINPVPPVIDGHMNDEIWQKVEWGSGFVQHEPCEGDPPSQATAFKILYDNKNIYIGIRAYDTEPEKIDTRLSRRDQIEGDLVAVQFDSYYDQQTAFTFMVNAGGGKMDGMYTNDGENQDWTPDPVWYTETSVDDKGWTAEMKIPLSQLRFSGKEQQVWGFQVGRLLFRKEELSLWQPIPRDAPGWVHRFGTLEGIQGLQSNTRVEILPYAVGKAESMLPELGNPFVNGSRRNMNFGVDGKMGITSDLTLDFTVNPDFGQVEADPSVVNLTAYETFYQEKRPFFIEGKNILSYPLMLGDGDMANNNLFYSRRIGRRPRYYPDTDDGEYVRMPENSTILGAAKMTGKTKNGLSVGVLDAVTQMEEAEIDRNGDRRFETVAPLTNYFLARMQKDYNEGATRMGGIITHTLRDIDSENLDFLNRTAVTGGLDLYHSWKDRTWFIAVKSIFSRITGTREAMIAQQRSPRRYFQRPDADYLKVDSSLTSLSGQGGSVFFGRQGNSHINFVVGSSWQSPGLEINDMGYMRESDQILQFSSVGFRWWEPFSIFRNMNINLFQWSVWNFGRANIQNGGNINMHAQFKNYWGAGFGINLNSPTFSTATLRGGPGIYLPSAWNTWFHMNTNQKNAVYFSLRGSYRKSNDGYSGNYSISPGINLRPGRMFSLELDPFYRVNRNNLQYVDEIDHNNNSRYLLSRISQTTLGMVLRLNYTITPNLTIQYYGQPFVSAGKYSRLKYVTDPKAERYQDRFHTYAGDEIEFDQETDTYYIDEDSDQETDYAVGSPDFNFRQFRSNLVIRWEYTPGSTLYLVWSQGRTDYREDGNYSFRNDMRDLFDVYPHDVFLIKLNKWFSL